MADLFEFLVGGDRSGSKLDKFNKELKGAKNDEDIRQLESDHLTPEVYSEYIGSKGVTDPIKDLVCKVAFKNKTDFDLFKKYFRVSRYFENNVSDLRLLIAFLKALDDGSVTWFDKTEKLIWGYHESGDNKKRRIIKR